MEENRLVGIDDDDENGDDDDDNDDQDNDDDNDDGSMYVSVMYLDPMIMHISLSAVS